MKDGVRGPNRRSVLKTGGAALAAMVGATAPTAASNFVVGDCAHVDVETGIYANGCPPGDQIGTAIPGECGYVEQVCDRFGAVYLSAVDGWVAESALVHC